MKRVLAILAILGLIAGLNAKTYSISYYGFDVAIDPSGCFATITETITYSFSGGTFEGAERSIALGSVPGYPSQVDFVSLSSPDANTPPTLTDNTIQKGYWILQWTFPPSSGKVTFVISYTANSIFTQSKGQNFFDYILIGAEWKNFNSFFGDFNNINVTMTIPSSVKGLSFSPSYTNKYERNGNTIVNWFQSYWPVGSIYEISAGFDSNASCRSGGSAPVDHWVIAIIVLACFFFVLGVVVAVLRFYCGMCRRGAYTVIADTGVHHHHGHSHHHSSSSSSARTGGGGAW